MSKNKEEPRHDENLLKPNSEIGKRWCNATRTYNDAVTFAVSQQRISYDHRVYAYLGASMHWYLSYALSHSIVFMQVTNNTQTGICACINKISVY